MDERLKLLKERVPAFEFEGKEARELAITALTHSSLSATRNGTELAKVGEAVRDVSAPVWGAVRDQGEMAPCLQPRQHDSH